MIIHVFCISYILELNFVFTKTLASITGAHWLCHNFLVLLMLFWLRSHRAIVHTFWFYLRSILWLFSSHRLTLLVLLTLDPLAPIHSLTSSHEAAGCSGPCILAERRDFTQYIPNRLPNVPIELPLNLRNELHLWSFDLCRALFGYEGSTDVLKVISKGGKTNTYFFHSSIILVKLCCTNFIHATFWTPTPVSTVSPPNHATQGLSADSGQPRTYEIPLTRTVYYCSFISYCLTNYQWLQGMTKN